MSASTERAESLKIIGDLEHINQWFENLGFSTAVELNRRAISNIRSLVGLIDLITSDPMTPAEAEAAYDNLPELSPEDRKAMESIDIDKIITYATDPMNASGEWMVRKLIEAAKNCGDFDREAFTEAERWLERRFS